MNRMADHGDLRRRSRPRRRLFDAEWMPRSARLTSDFGTKEATRPGSNDTLSSMVGRWWRRATQTFSSWTAPSAPVDGISDLGLSLGVSVVLPIRRRRSSAVPSPLLRVSEIGESTASRV